MFQLLTFLILLGLGFWVGGQRNARHLQRLDARERNLQTLPTTNGLIIPGMVLTEPTLVHGGVVISVDYFKRIGAIVGAIFGGRLYAYESLMERGRREALLRMREAAKAAVRTRSSMYGLKPPESPTEPGTNKSPVLRCWPTALRFEAPNLPAFRAERVLARESLASL